MKEVGKSNSQTNIQFLIKIMILKIQISMYRQKAQADSIQTVL